MCVSTTTHTHLHQLFLLTLSKEKMPTDEKHEKIIQNSHHDRASERPGRGVRKTLSAPEVYFGQLSSSRSKATQPEEGNSCKLQEVSAHQQLHATSCLQEDHALLVE